MLKKVWLRELINMTCTSGSFAGRRIGWTDDGIVAFITNRAYLSMRGRTTASARLHTKSSATFTSLTWARMCGVIQRFQAQLTMCSAYRQAFLSGSSCAKNQSKGSCGIHYASREDAELAVDKLAYLNKATLDSVVFE